MFIVVSFDCVVPKSCSLVHGKDNDPVCEMEHHVDSGRVSLYEFDGQFLFLCICDTLWHNY